MKEKVLTVFITIWVIITIVTGFFTYKYFTSDEAERSATIAQIKSAILNVASDFGYKRSSSANRSLSNEITVYADSFSSYWGLSESEYSDFTQEEQDAFWNRNHADSIYNQLIAGRVAPMIYIVATWADGLAESEMTLDSIYEVHDVYYEYTQTVEHSDEILAYAKISCDRNNNIKMYLMTTSTGGFYEIDLKYDFKSNSDYEIEYKAVISENSFSGSECMFAKKIDNKFEKVIYGCHADEYKITIGEWDFLNSKFVFYNNNEVNEFVSALRTAIINKIVDNGVERRVKSNLI